MSLRHTLLGLLDWVPSHGYALRELAKGYSWVYPMTNANIYPTLRQLEGEGLVTHKSEIHDGRHRKVYAITPDGRAEVRRWLADPTNQRGTYRDPALLKLCLLRPGSFDGARRWIAQSLAEARQGCEEGQAWMYQNASWLPKYSRLAAEHGVALARLRAEWLESVLREIEQEPEVSS